MAMQPFCQQIHDTFVVLSTEWEKLSLSEISNISNLGLQLMADMNGFSDPAAHNYSLKTMMCSADNIYQVPGIYHFILLF